jgi:hypothetical protein
MKKLLKDYHLNSDMQYFEMIVASVINGQREQAKKQFKAMSIEYQKMFLKSIYGYWSSGLPEKDKLMFIDCL